MITPVTAHHLPLVGEHLARLRGESGRDGLHFMPFAPGSAEGPKGPDHLRLGLPLIMPGWARCFGAWNQDGTRLIGHVDLSGGRLETELHRCTLGIGIEAAWCGQGLGESLMRTAIDFAAAVPTLDWIDLFVFGHNSRARRLYQRMGFVERGMVPDKFRIGALSIDDVSMTLALR